MADGVQNGTSAAGGEVRIETRDNGKALRLIAGPEFRRQPDPGEEGEARARRSGEMAALQGAVCGVLLAAIGFAAWGQSLYIALEREKARGAIAHLMAEEALEAATVCEGKGREGISEDEGASLIMRGPQEI